MEKPYYTAPELAELMGMTVKSLHNALHAERFPIPTYKLGKIRVADKEVVRQFFAQKSVEGLQKLQPKSEVTT